MTPPRFNPWLSSACALAAALALWGAPARAQVEARCPTGWTARVLPDSPAQRMIAACVQEPMQIVASELAEAIAPNTPGEREIAEQMTTQLAQGGTTTVSPYRAVTLAGVAARVADFAGAMPTEDGTNEPMEGSLTLLPVSGHTVMVMALSRTPARANAREAAAAFVPTMVGLTGPPMAWRASATCPAPLREMPAEGAPAFGMRRVIRCGLQGASIDVFESRLPMRSPDDARSAADLLLANLRRRLQAMGGAMPEDAPRAVTFGAEHGFVVALHGSAQDPSAPPDAPPALRVEAQVVSVVTPVGHVRIMALTQLSDAAALTELVRGFATTNLRLDGTNVPPPGPPPTPGATGPDGGPMMSTPTPNQPPQPPPRRRREIDLSQPMWEPPPSDLARHAATPATSGADDDKTKKYAVGFLVAFVVLLGGVVAYTRFRK